MRFRSLSSLARLRSAGRAGRGAAGRGAGRERGGPPTAPGPLAGPPRCRGCSPPSAPCLPPAAGGTARPSRATRPRCGLTGPNCAAGPSCATRPCCGLTGPNCATRPRCAAGPGCAIGPSHVTGPSCTAGPKCTTGPSCAAGPSHTTKPRSTARPSCASRPRCATQPSCVAGPGCTTGFSRTAGPGCTARPVTAGPGCAAHPRAWSACSHLPHEVPAGRSGSSPGGGSAPSPSQVSPCHRPGTEPGHGGTWLLGPSGHQRRPQARAHQAIYRPDSLGGTEKRMYFMQHSFSRRRRGAGGAERGCVCAARGRLGAGGSRQAPHPSVQCSE